MLHLGDHNLSGGAIRFPGAEEYERLVAGAEEPFRRADLTETLRMVDRNFGSGTYTLRLLFRDEQQKVLGLILRSVLGSGRRGLPRALRGARAPDAVSLEPRHRAAAGIPHGGRARPEHEPPPGARGGGPRALAPLRRSLAEARDVGVTLHEDGLGLALEHTLERLAEGLQGNPTELGRLEELEAVVDLARQLPFEVDFWQVQNAYYQLSKTLLPPGAGRPRRASRTRAAGSSGSSRSVKNSPSK